MKLFMGEDANLLLGSSRLAKQVDRTRSSSPSHGECEGDRKEVENSTEFEVNDWVYLKVSPMKDVMRFGKKGKLSPWYIGPYRISKRIGNVDYMFDLSQELAVVHPVFHVSVLKKFMGMIY